MLTSRFAVMDRDRRLTGSLRGQTNSPIAAAGFELNNPWRVSSLGPSVPCDRKVLILCVQGGTKDNLDRTSHYHQRQRTTSAWRETFSARHRQKVEGHDIGRDQFGSCRGRFIQFISISSGLSNRIIWNCAIIGFAACSCSNPPAACKLGTSPGLTCSHTLHTFP